jgi:hypothetical protein
MSKRKMSDLRDHLFETLEALKDKEHPMELDRAKTIANVAQAIVHSAKVEVDFMRLTDHTPENDFFAVTPPEPTRLANGNGRALPPHNGKTNGSGLKVGLETGKHLGAPVV